LNFKLLVPLIQRSNIRFQYMANSTLYIIIFIITVSTIFPLVGYYLDYRHGKKARQGRRKNKKVQP
jgi:hypothetical protein